MLVHDDHIFARCVEQQEHGIWSPIVLWHWIMNIWFRILLEGNLFCFKIEIPLMQCNLLPKWFKKLNTHWFGLCRSYLLLVELRFNSIWFDSLRKCCICFIEAFFTITRSKSRLQKQKEHRKENKEEWKAERKWKRSDAKQCKVFKEWTFCTKCLNSVRKAQDPFELMEKIQAKASTRQKNNDQKQNTKKKYSQAIVMFRFDKYFYGNTKNENAFEQRINIITTILSS